MDANAHAGLFFSSLDPIQTKPDATAGPRWRRTPVTEADRRIERIANERSIQFPPASATETAFRHRCWLPSRTRVRAALAAAHVPAARLDRFDNCGADCIIEVSDDGADYRVRACFCGDRFCTPCSRARARVVQENLERWCDGQRVRFVTLTMQHTDEPLARQIDRLLQSFVRLRACKCWSDNVTGGAYVVEIKLDAKRERYHVHLHALVIGSYVSQHELSKAWKRSSRGSYIVHVRAVDDQRHGARYVAKYATKAWDSSVDQVPDCLLECVLALRGRRMLGTFGIWRNRGLERQVDDQREWRRVGRLDQVAVAAGRCEPWAVGLFRALGLRVDASGREPVFGRLDRS